MPYEFVWPDRSPVGKGTTGMEKNDAEDEDGDARIQRELDAWRLQMREERRRRLLAAAERAERTRNGDESSASHFVSAEEPRRGTRRQSMSALEEYRRELGEVAAQVQRGGRKPWNSSTTNQQLNQKQSRGTKQGRVTYHEARSVLREYIQRPQPCSRIVEKTLMGTLRAYRDALSVSARACSESSASPSPWHQKPLRSISVTSRPTERSKLASVSTNRSARLRKRQTELSLMNSGANGKIKADHHDPQKHEHSRKSKTSSSSFLEPTESYRSAIKREEQQCRQQQQHSRQFHRKSFPPDDGISMHSGDSSRCVTQRRSVTQPMVTTEFMESPQPREPSYMPYFSQENQRATSHADETSDVGDADPPHLTHVFRGIDTDTYYEKKCGRKSSTVLQDLLDKLALASPSLYRPDLYQGQGGLSPTTTTRVQSVKPQPWP